MIDYSKWEMTAEKYDPHQVRLFNVETGETTWLFLSREKEIINSDNVIKYVKDRCKQAIRLYYAEKYLERLIDKSTPVETNLDLIEQEYNKSEEQK